MKFMIVFFALAVCASATSVVIETETFRKVEIPSMSAVLVTELLETTFHVEKELAQQIGHLFRNVPISLAKEMIAFVVKVFGDITGGHLDSLSQYAEHALHIFQQVMEHIDTKELIELVASNVLPEKWNIIIQKLLGSFGRVRK